MASHATHVAVEAAAGSAHRPRAAIHLGSTAYPTATAAKDAIRAMLLDCLPGGPEFGDVPRNVALTLGDLIARHPEAVEKVGPGVARFMVRRNPRNPTAPETWLERVDGTRVDFSWHKAVRGVPSTPEHNLKQAMRHSVRDQVRAFRELAPLPAACDLCGEMMRRGDDLHVDHVTMFDQLVADFLPVTTAPVPIAFDDDPDVCSPVFRFQDSEFALAWYKYHSVHALVRLVHARCNLSRGRSTT